MHKMGFYYSAVKQWKKIIKDMLIYYALI